MHIFTYVQISHETDTCVLCFATWSEDLEILGHAPLCLFIHFQYLNTISIFLQFTMFLNPHHEDILFPNK